MGGIGSRSETTHKEKVIAWTRFAMMCTKSKMKVPGQKTKTKVQVPPSIAFDAKPRNSDCDRKRHRASHMNFVSSVNNVSLCTCMVYSRSCRRAGYIHGRNIAQLTSP